MRKAGPIAIAPAPPAQDAESGPDTEGCSHIVVGDTHNRLLQVQGIQGDLVEPRLKTQRCSDMRDAMVRPKFPYRDSHCMHEADWQFCLY